MATDWPLRRVANPDGVATRVLSSDVVLYHIQGAMGNRGYFGSYLRAASAAIG
jgi:hypothetical protein